MGQRFFAGLSKVLNVGTAYLQHVQFVNSALRAPQSELGGLLVQYTQGLSEASFAGFKVTLTMLANNEQNSQRKGLIQSLLKSADAARTGNIAASLVDASTTTAPNQGSFDHDLDLMSTWYEQMDNDQRVKCLSEHVTSLTPHGYRSFTANLAEMRDNVLHEKRQHEENEANAWGGFVEDRMAYQMARLRTGQRDPTFMRKLGELQRLVDFIEWLIKANDAVWQAHLEQQAAAAKPQSAAKPTGPNAKAIREAIRTFTQTGR